MFISGSPFSGTFSDMLDYVDGIKDTLGATVFLPGGTYDATGLTIPRNISVHGNGIVTKITGNPTILTGNDGGKVMQNINFVDGFKLLNCRNVLMHNLYINGSVELSGPSYYNTFVSCQWRDLGSARGIFTHSNEQNANHLYGCRFNHTNIAVDLLGDGGVTPAPRGWIISGTTFDGDTGESPITLEPAIASNAPGHVFDGNWFERAGSNAYKTTGAPFGTIWLGADSTGCKVGVSRMNVLVTVIDYGTNNLIENQAAYETITDNGDHVIYRFD